MLTIEPTGAILGATIAASTWRGRFPEPEFGRILLALGQHGVLRFPDQQLDIGDVKRFSELFGEIQGNPIRAADTTHGLTRRSASCPTSRRTAPISAAPTPARTGTPTCRIAKPWAS